MNNNVTANTSKADWRQFVKTGIILAISILLIFLSCHFFIFPKMKEDIKNDVKNQLLYEEIVLDDVENEEVSFDKKEQEYVTAEFETELRTYLEEYFQNMDLNAYFGEDGMKKLVEQITLRLKESNNTILSQENMEPIITKELEKVFIIENEMDEEILQELKRELMEKINQLAESGNYDAIIEKHSTTLSTILTDMSMTKEELLSIQESLLRLFGDMGDCNVTYDEEDGHFYITYKGGADSVTKKLDYVP